MKTLLCLISIGLVPAAAAQDFFTVPWSAISSGGVASAEPAEFTLRGSALGQFSAGGSSDEPGEFDVTGGYWTFPFQPTLPDLHLAMQLLGPTVTLTWDEDGPPVVLESSADLELWVPVDPQPVAPFFQETAGGRKFYRLSPP